MSRARLRVVALFAAVALAASGAHAAPGYTFTRLVDHVDDNFSPRSLTCASINASGDVAFKGTRSAPDGLSSWDVIARVNREGVITTIAEDPERTQFQFFSNFVSINDSGDTAFAAFQSNDEIAIFRADGTSLVTIASTAGEFSSFGFDTSLNNSGEVAFTAATRQRRQRPVLGQWRCRHDALHDYDASTDRRRDDAALRGKFRTAVDQRPERRDFVFLGSYRQPGLREKKASLRDEPVSSGRSARRTASTMEPGTAAMPITMTRALAHSKCRS